MTPTADTSSAGRWDLLRCPVTGDRLVFAAAQDQPLPGNGFGLLHGGAGPYPVVDGVPVLRRGEVSVQSHVSGAREARGPEVADLVRLIDTGHSLDALLALLVLTPSPHLRGRRVPGSGRVLRRRVPGAVARRVRHHQLRARLGHGRRDGSTQWWMELFHTRSEGVDAELVHYFRHRTVQPRYLAAHAALRAVTRADGVVLDLACGYGHLSAEVLTAGSSTTVVGLDRTFFPLWLATHLIAPGGLFVCADAAGGLPLDDGAVDAAFCSDAFHYLPGPEAVLDELLRVCPTGPLVLTRLGHRDHEPHEGAERSPQEWAQLAGAHHHRLVTETDLVQAYLRRTPVTGSDPSDLRDGKWLTLLLSGDPATDLGPDAPTDWPHGRGRRHLNPLYEQRPRRDGGLDLALRMPSPWYAFENDGLRSYHVASASVGPQVLRALSEQVPSDEVDRLVEQFVVVGGAGARATTSG